MRTGIFTALLTLAVTAHGATISGTILPPGRAKAVKAFQRLGATPTAINNRYYEGSIDQATGRFDVPDLPDGTYQLIIDCGDAAIEGIDLRIDGEEALPTFDYVFKTRKLTSERLELSNAFDPDEAVSEQRKNEAVGRLVGLPKLLEKLESLRQVDRFCDHFRPLCAHGAGDKALVLVELARLSDFHAGKGQVIYRVEVWPFERAGAAWDHSGRGVRVLQRHRLPREEYLKLGSFFEPRLGGLRILNGVSLTGIEYAIPEKWDDATGKAPGQNVPQREPEPPPATRAEE